MARSADNAVAAAPCAGSSGIAASLSVAPLVVYRVVALSGGIHPVDSGAGAESEPVLGQAIAAPSFLVAEHGISVFGMLCSVAGRGAGKVESDPVLVHFRARLGFQPRICVREIQRGGEHWVSSSGSHGV